MTDTIPGQAVSTGPSTDPWFQRSYTPESVRSYADRVAPGWHVAHKPEGRGSFGTRIDATAHSLDQLYVILDARPVPTYLPGEKLDPLLELRQNPRLLRSVVMRAVDGSQEIGPFTPRDPRTRERRAAHRDGGRRLPASNRLGI